MNQADLQVPERAQHGVVTVGNFDGVHCGHQRMLATLREIAAAQQAPAVVVTFDPHPLTILHPELPLPRLTSIDHRRELLLRYGADEVVVLPVSADLLQMTADEFFHQILRGRLNAAAVVEGPNFNFGRDRGGDVRHLAHLCDQQQIPFQVIEAVEDTGRMISSSRIREQIQQGQLRDAVAMLGHTHRISGTVSQGAQRGRTLGFPTANLEQIPMLLPGNGVYAGVTAVDKTSYVTAVSIGPNPTFDDGRLKIECYLDGFAGDLYGQTLDVDLLAEIRPLQTFDSVDALTDRIQQDVESCRALVTQLTQPIYKICTQAEWEAAVLDDAFDGSEVDLQDGFIHFSTAFQVQTTAQKHFADQTDLVLVEINPLRLGSALKWEPSRGGDLFPHLYGELPVAAAASVQPLPWENQQHQFPAGVLPE